MRTSYVITASAARSRAPAGPLAHYGSLVVPRAAKPLVDSALAYLRRDAVERALIARVEHSRVRHRIVIDHHGDDSYAPGVHAIFWDPTSAMHTTHGGSQSPALGLGHELDHAAVGDAMFDMLAAIPDRRFDNLEERRVILGSERHAAHALHESARDDHRGRNYRVTSPTER